MPALGGIGSSFALPGHNDTLFHDEAIACDPPVPQDVRYDQQAARRRGGSSEGRRSDDAQARPRNPSASRICPPPLLGDRHSHTRHCPNFLQPCEIGDEAKGESSMHRACADILRSGAVPPGHRRAPAFSKDRFTRDAWSRGLVRCAAEHLMGLRSSSASSGGSSFQSFHGLWVPDRPSAHFLARSQRLCNAGDCARGRRLRPPGHGFA